MYNYFNMQSHIILKIILLLSVWNTSQGWRSFKIAFEESSVEFDERFINMSVGISTNSHNQTLLNAYVTLLEDIDNILVFYTFHSAAQSEFKKSNANIKQHHATLVLDTGTELIHLLNTKGNFCRFLNGRKDGNIRRLFEEMQKFGKVFQECPLKRDSYYIQEFMFDPEIAPPYLPEATFHAMGRLYRNDTKGALHTILKLILTGKIDKSQGLDNLKEFSLG